MNHAYLSFYIFRTLHGTLGRKHMFMFWPHYEQVAKCYINQTLIFI